MSKDVTGIGQVRSTARLLLTTVCRPLGPKYGDGLSVGYELLHGQVTRAQGIFSPRTFQRHFSLDYIAHNLDSPTVVLQYPSERELIRELKRGYEYVGVSFLLATFHRMKRVVALIRKYAPQSRIILGGYGTVLGDEVLKLWGDHICREEGVGFLRRLLGEPPKPMPYEHPMIVNHLWVFSLRRPPHGMVFAGLGCPNGCDFCCTSHFFRRRHIKLLPTGRDIFTVMKRYADEHNVHNCTVIDEDFLLNKARAMEFLECVRASTFQPSFFAFASVKALSQYTIEELLEMGLDGVWMGFEGKRSGFAKQSGRPIEELIDELRSHGITVLTSMIVGFDYQTPEIVQEELDELMRIRPTLAQFLIYGPTPGTPFYERIMAEGRLVPELTERPEDYYRKCTGFYGMVQHPTMTSGMLERLQQQCFRQDFERLGPTMVRAMENWLSGYHRLKGSACEALRQRAALYRSHILGGRVVLFPARWLGPSRAARRAARDLHWAIRREFGRLSVAEHVKSWVAMVMAMWTAVSLRCEWLQHPRLVRTEYRSSGSRRGPKLMPDVACVVESDRCEVACR